MDYLEQAFKRLNTKELKAIETNLQNLKLIFMKEKSWNQLSLKKHPTQLMSKLVKLIIGVRVAKVKVNLFAMVVTRALNLPPSN